MKEWKEFADRLSRNDASSVLRTDNRNFNRLIIGRAVEVGVDSIGRILVPEHLREYAGLTERAAIIGVMNRVEIWDADVWEAYRSEFAKKTDVIAEKLASAGVI
jgi:MraZ protein